MVGTSVRDSRYDASIANTTAIASGVNRYRAVPVSSSTGTNTMQIDSVETNVGTAICDAPSSTALHQRLPHRQIAMRILDLHRRIVHQDADRQRQPAQRHHVDGLAQQAQDRRAKSESRAESRCRRSACCASFPGTAGSSVPVSSAAISVSRTTPLIDARTKSD